MENVRNLFEMKIKIEADPAFLRRIWTYTSAVHTEVSGLFEVEWSPDQSIITIPDTLHMFKQRGSGGGTHLDMDAVAEWALEKAERGEATGTTRGWWHTHVGMQVFFSGTDENTIEKLHEFWGEPFVAVVTNNRGESRWRAFMNGKSVEWFAKLDLSAPSAEERQQAKRILEPLIKEESVPFGLGRKRKPDRYHDTRDSLGKKKAKGGQKGSGKSGFEFRWPFQS